MKIVRGYDEATCERIARASGSAAVKKSVAWLRRLNYDHKELFICEVFDDVAFYAGLAGKNHFRLYEIACEEQAQRSGYGRAMITRIKRVCRDKGLKKITLKTSAEEGALEFYKKVGGRAVGRKDGEWEVEIEV